MTLEQLARISFLSEMYGNASKHSKTEMCYILPDLDALSGTNADAKTWDNSLSAIRLNLFWQNRISNIKISKYQF